MKKIIKKQPDFFLLFISKVFNVKWKEAFRCKLKNIIFSCLASNNIDVTNQGKRAGLQPALAKLPQMYRLGRGLAAQRKFLYPCPLLFILLGIYNFDQTLGYSLNRAIKRKVKLSFAQPNFSNDAVDLLRWGVTVQKGCQGSSIKDVGIFLVVFATPFPHVGILTLVYLTYTF